MTRYARSLLASLALVILATGCGSDDTATKPSTQTSQPPALHGGIPSGQVARPDFTLRDTSGHRYDFGQQTNGRITLLYAGYTHCPDECPTMMADIASALRRLPAAVNDQVKVVFVTTDPWRDTGPVVRRWLDGFHPPTPYVGLTGTLTQLSRADVALGIPKPKREKAPKSYGSGKFAVTHFDGLILYGTNDRLLTIYPNGTKPGDIAADLKSLAA